MNAARRSQKLNASNFFEVWWEFLFRHVLRCVDEMILDDVATVWSWKGENTILLLDQDGMMRNMMK